MKKAFSPIVDILWEIEANKKRIADELDLEYQVNKNVQKLHDMFFDDKGWDAYEYQAEDTK